MSAQILQLTGVIKRGDSPNVYVGCIKEISGIIAQGSSVDEVYDDLLEGTRGMLDYKRKEALALLKQQAHGNESVETNAHLDFALNKQLVEA